MPSGLVIGGAIGLFQGIIPSFGVGSLGAGMAIGVAIGAGIGFLMDKKKNPNPIPLTEKEASIRKRTWKMALIFLIVGIVAGAAAFSAFHRW